MRTTRWVAGIAVVLWCAAGLVTSTPTAQAICGSIGGRHVDVSGCADPLSELDDALNPPPPPAPNVTVCANVGRRISVSGCV